jgi:HlyD family secretion protein
MTANVRIVSDSRENVLKVANAALRWRPAGAGGAEPAAAPGVPSGGGGAGDAQARRQRLVDDLKLDAAQTARVDEIFAEQRNRFAELRDLNDADRRQRGERMRADVRQKINAILNAEQQKRYAEIVASETGRTTAGSGRVYTLVDVKPTEVAIRTGLTDGNATEVVSGALAEGQEVIVGTQLTNAPAPKASSSPRMPF